MPKTMNDTLYKLYSEGVSLSPEEFVVAEAKAELLAVLKAAAPPKIDLQSRMNIYRQMGEEGVRQHTYDKAQNEVIDRYIKNIEELLS